MATLKNDLLMQSEIAKKRSARQASASLLNGQLPTSLGVIIDLVTSNAHPKQEIPDAQMLWVRSVCTQC